MMFQYMARVCVCVSGSDMRVHVRDKVHLVVKIDILHGIIAEPATQH